MENSYSLCNNIKSKRNPKIRCSNIATHGDYCGIHYKNPKPWIQFSTQKSRFQEEKSAEVTEFMPPTGDAAIKIQRWLQQAIRRHMARTRGPAFYNRQICTNDTDFFSTDPVADISGALFFSYIDKKHVYGFDIRSIATLIANTSAQAAPQNPFTRDPIPLSVIQKVDRIVKMLKAHKFSTEWAKLSPSSPIQQYRMKIVDLFQAIDELNYYSSPDWFLNMNLVDHCRFYRNLYAIWNYRANLSSLQKIQIVPNIQQQPLFKHSPYAISSYPLERLQKLNMGIIRTLITAAEDKNDRILGAMYVMTSLTLVSIPARIAYPWLYESVSGDERLEHVPSPIIHMPEWNRNVDLAPLRNMPPLSLD